MNARKPAEALPPGEFIRDELDLFYANVNVDDFKVAARASTERGQITPEQLAWCVRALKLTESIPVSPFQLSKLNECKKKLRQLAAFPEGVIDIDLLGTERRNEDVIPIEERANQEAGEMLIPSDKLESFILRKRPSFSKVAIIQFANANKIHPGIVAGQLHYLLKNWSANREMLVKIRDLVTSRALTDGWGVKIVK